MPPCHLALIIHKILPKTGASPCSHSHSEPFDDIYSHPTAPGFSTPWLPYKTCASGTRPGRDSAAPAWDRAAPGLLPPWVYSHPWSQHRIKRNKLLRSHPKTRQALHMRYFSYLKNYPRLPCSRTILGSVKELSYRILIQLPLMPGEGERRNSWRRQMPHKQTLSSLNKKVLKSSDTITNTAFKPCHPLENSCY